MNLFVRLVGLKLFSRSLRYKNVYYQIAELDSSLDEVERPKNHHFCSLNKLISLIRVNIYKQKTNKNLNCYTSLFILLLLYKIKEYAIYLSKLPRFVTKSPTSTLKMVSGVFFGLYVKRVMAFSGDTVALALILIIFLIP